LPLLAALAAAGAAAAVQVSPLVLVDAGAPVLCAFVYSKAADFELRVEKGVRAGAVFTALDAVGADAVELRTASFDSQRELRAVPARRAGSVRLEADLQDDDRGGLLFAELAVSGGELRLRRAADWQTVALPAPLPRDMTAIYLNCAGDLVPPELSPEPPPVP